MQAHSSYSHLVPMKKDRLSKFVTYWSEYQSRIVFFQVIFVSDAYPLLKGLLSNKNTVARTFSNSWFFASDCGQKEQIAVVSCVW